MAEVKSVLVIGASRGLGAGLVKEFLERGWQVTATVRARPASSQFEALKDQVSVEILDINDTLGVKKFVRSQDGILFDIVFINAGVGEPHGKDVSSVTPEEISHLFMTNAISPVRLAMKLVANVRPGSGILAIMTSVLGSVTRGSGDYAPLYSASKSALNQLTKSFAGALKENITILSLHPGWVKTDMGGPDADIDVATSVRGLADVLEAKAGNHKHEFLDYQGETIPW